MKFSTLIIRSLRFHWRSHLGVVLGAAVGSAALIGALVVGDSVRQSLRETALERLGPYDVAMAPRDRFFRQELGMDRNKSLPLRLGNGDEVRLGQTANLLRLPGMISRQDGAARANQVNVFGVLQNFWSSNDLAALGPIPTNSVLLNQSLAAQLKAKPGDQVVLRIHKPTALSRDVPITPQSDSSIALRLQVHGVVDGSKLGNFSLRANQTPPLNAFVNLHDLSAPAGLEGKANMALLGQTALIGKGPFDWLRPLMEKVGLKSANDVNRPASLSADALAQFYNSNWVEYATLSDFELKLRAVPNDESARFLELSSPRIFLEPAINQAALTPAPEGSAKSRVVKRSLDSAAIKFESQVAQVTNGIPILTYLVNLFRAETNTVPYSMVTAAGAPWTPAGMPDDEILVNPWLANELKVGVGDSLQLTYFLPDSGSRLVEGTNQFRVRAVVPLEGLYADRALMPEFPGLAKAESTHDWDAGFPLAHEIRQQDEDYWKQHRGTPKAFITLAAGQKMWANRFGDLTAIRFPLRETDPSLAASGFENPDLKSASTAKPDPNRRPAGIESKLAGVVVEKNLLANLNPADLGLQFEPVRDQALKAANQSQDFGGLFIGFSFFLIIAALILMALLFQFGLEQRISEIGTLLALGFRAKQVRRLFLGEGVALAAVGGLMGMIGGLAYAWAMLRGLTTIWRDAVSTSALSFHVTPTTLVIGAMASVVVSALTIGLTLRKQARQPARELLAGETATGTARLSGASQKAIPLTLTGKVRRVFTNAVTIGGVSLLGALGLLGWTLASGDASNAGLFFGAGSLLLIAGIAFTAYWLRHLDVASSPTAPISLSSLTLRALSRRRSRSLAVVSLLACGSFLIAAIGAFKLDANQDATQRASGTGGFALLGQSTLPVIRDLNTQSGREFYVLDESDMEGVAVVPLRVRDGDDASCLNLNRAQKPRLLGVKPALLAERQAFTFAKVAKGQSIDDGWQLLNSAVRGPQSEIPEVPAIGDLNSILWAMGKKVGDAIDYVDERGQPFKIRIVGAVANSILQGSLLIAEHEFVQRFPSESGYRMFLIDAPVARVDQVSASLSRALQDVGLELTSTTRRLAQFNAVQNTYLNTFQVLGGLGLLLGSAGLGVVVLRNVLERRGELALLLAVGFRRRTLRQMVLGEHSGLLILGLGIGIFAAVVGILPQLIAPGARISYATLGWTLLAVLVSGLLWTWLATMMALRGKLLNALRNE